MEFQPPQYVNGPMVRSRIREWGSLAVITMLDNHFLRGFFQGRLTKSKFGCRHLRALTMTALCMALILATVGPAQAMVVCVGANGHVDVEVALGGCYSEPHGQETTQPLNFDSDHIDCVGCTDFRLSTPALQTNVQRPKPAFPNFNQVGVAAQVSSSGVCITKTSTFEVSSTFQTLDLLSTVVQLN